ncbi:hypothetical protein OG863_19615 [Streptomyces decoyicus]|uniref:Lipoprotein n=1 Tax=Streptomyces decoyicus TaxID=249567 RepID=A0ABZ1FHW4_9ACTN|nr:hypothetical protein [Streptomyces decoyicus]WSB69976.1 hypothetical protein OG863_19615 [Streptomyces decoyicus]
MKKIATATLCAALLMGAAAPASAGEQAPRPGPGVYASNGDHVHVSSTKPATASGHGWWFKVKGPGSKAKVTIWLQTRKKGAKKWHTVAKGSKIVKPSKKLNKAPSTWRANARKKCANRQVREWRSVIDTDIIGVADSPEKAVTKVRPVKCGV